MSNIKVPNEVAAQLRPLAATLGFKMKRGPGKIEEMGSLPGLISAISQAYRGDPDAVLMLVQQILNRRRSVQEVNEMIKRDGAIII